MFTQQVVHQHVEGDKADLALELGDEARVAAPGLDLPLVAVAADRAGEGVERPPSALLLEADGVGVLLAQVGVPLPGRPLEGAERGG